ncbi:MAG: hypothetical protein ACLSVD_10115 [Eggerthellaceae bacterium]
MGGASAEGRMAIRVSDLSRVQPQPARGRGAAAHRPRRHGGRIEEVLYVSQGTVKAHINHIYPSSTSTAKASCSNCSTMEKPVRKGRRSSSSLGRTRSGKQDRGGTVAHAERLLGEVCRGAVLCCCALDAR